MPPRFVQDIQVEGALHVVTVRSQRASAILAGVSLPDLPAGVLAILSADIPGRRTLDWGGRSHPILASDAVRYVGEPVALVAAPELEVAQRVASEVILRYEDPPPAEETQEPATSWLRAASDSGRELPEPETTPEVSKERQIVTSPRRFAPPAPQEAVAYWEGQVLVVRTASRDPFHVRDTVAAVLDLPTAKVRVMGEPLDGPHGKHLMPSLVAAHVALVCARGRAPARVRYSWREELGASFRMPGTQGRWSSRGELGLLHLAFEGGAYDPMAGEVVRRALQAVPGPYRRASIHFELEYRFSETVPCELPPGCGALEATLVRELWISDTARERAVDPATHRLELLGGLVAPDTARHRKPKIHSPGGSAGEVIEEVVRRSGFHRRWAACEAAAQRRGEDASIPLKGIGIALATFPEGFDEDTERGVRVRLTMGRDRRVTVFTSAVEAGHGDRELTIGLVSGILGVPAETVEYAPLDTLSVPDSGATAASRTAAILTPLVRRCAGLLKRRIARGRFPVSVESTHRPAPRPAGGGLAATVVAVEIEPDTAELRCTGAWVVIDAGEILDPPRARAVAAAAVVRGLAIATTEQSDAALVPVPPASGPYAAPAPNYRVASITDHFPLEISFLPHDAERAPPASRGISELALLGVPAAAAAAAEQAMGRAVLRLPFDPEAMP